jgi:D-psicose/D-tagatose/L-ribulose 3-epimerase
MSDARTGIMAVGTGIRAAVCNELFGAMPFAKACDLLASQGYAGVEIAPYTLFGDFSASAVASGLAEARAALAASGISFAGFHWLLVKPAGLHITTADVALRRRSWDHVRRLLDASAELGGGNLILGSPKQRSAGAGRKSSEVTAILRDELAAIAPYAAVRNSAILLEALDSSQTDVVNTIAEAVGIVGSIGSPGVGTMFDFHNTGSETEDWEALIRRHGEYIRHVHANEVDGGHPGGGKSDYAPAFRALADSGYEGWTSIEIFTTPADPAAVLGESMSLFRSLFFSIAPPRQGRRSHV